MCATIWMIAMCAYVCACMYVLCVWTKLKRELINEKNFFIENDWERD